MNQTISERKRLSRHVAGLDHKHNPARHPVVPYIERLAIVALIVLLVACH